MRVDSAEAVAVPDHSLAVPMTMQLIVSVAMTVVVMVMPHVSMRRGFVIARLARFAHSKALGPQQVEPSEASTPTSTMPLVWDSVTKIPRITASIGLPRAPTM